MRQLRSGQSNISFGATCIVVAVIVAGGTVLANRDESDNPSRAASVRQFENTASHTPSVSNSSSTTITVNGQITQVDGLASVEKSYISDDGSTSVDISVHNSQSSSSSSSRVHDDQENDMD